MWGLFCEEKERPLKSPRGQWGRPAIDMPTDDCPPQRSPWAAAGTMALLQHSHLCLIQICGPLALTCSRTLISTLVHNTIMELYKLFILPSRGRYLAFSQQV